MMSSVSFYSVLMLSLAFSFYQLPYPWDFFRIETVSPLRFTINVASYCVLFSIFSYKTVNLFLRCINHGQHNEISKFRKIMCNGFGFISARVAWGLFLAMTYFLTCSYYPWFVAAEIALFCYMEKFWRWSDLNIEMEKRTSDPLLKDQMMVQKGTDHPYKPLFVSKTPEDKTSLSATRSSSVPANFIPTVISTDSQTNPAPISLSTSVQEVNLLSTKYAETQADLAPRSSSNNIQINNLPPMNSVETQASFSPSTSSFGIQTLLRPSANSVQTQAEYFSLISPGVVQPNFPVPSYSIDTQTNYFPSAASVATQANILMPSASAAVQANYIPSVGSDGVQANRRPSTNSAAVEANLRPSTDSAETQANVFLPFATTAVQAHSSIEMCSIGSEAYILPSSTFQDEETRRFCTILSESTQTIFTPSNVPMETQTIPIPSVPLDIPLMISRSSQTIYLPSTTETSCQAGYQPLTSSIETQADYLQSSSSIGVQADYAQPAPVPPDIYQPLNFTSSAQTNKLPSVSSAAIQADYLPPPYPSSTKVNHETSTESTEAQISNEYKEHFLKKYGSIEKTRHEQRKRAYLSTRSENYATSSRPKYSEFEYEDDENLFPETPPFVSRLPDSITNFDSIEKTVSYTPHDFKPPAVDDMDVQISKEYNILSNSENKNDEVFLSENFSLISKLLTSVTDYLGKDSTNQQTSKSNLSNHIASYFKRDSIEQTLSQSQQSLVTPSVEHDAHLHSENEEDESFVSETQSILSKLSDNITNYFKRDSIEQPLSESQQGFKAPSTDYMKYGMRSRFERKEDDISVPKPPSLISKLSNSVTSFLKRDSAEQPNGRTGSYFKAPSADDMEYHISDEDEDADYKNVEKGKSSEDKIRTASRGPSILDRLYGFTESSPETSVGQSDISRNRSALKKIQEEKIKQKRISGAIGPRETKSYVVRRKGYCGGCWKPGRPHIPVNGRLEPLRQQNTTRTGKVYGPEKCTMTHGQFMQEYGL